MSWLAGGIILGVIAIVVGILVSTQPFRTSTLSEIGQERVGIVLGALVYRSGEPSPILRDRIEGGVQLYEAGKVQKLLMSGGNQSVDYNEVQAMKNYAIEAGVPEADIVLDYGGRSTYDSCYRAKHIFQLERAVLITQNYHLPRAVYLCRQMGIEANGYGMSDFDRYPDLRLRYTIREVLAQVKAWYDVEIRRPEPAILGEVEPEI